MAASVWGPGSQDLPEVDAQSTLKFERRVTTQGQTLINLSTFTYVQNVGSLIVLHNDSVLLPNVQYTEISTNAIQLVQPAESGDIVTILGFVGITVQLNAPSDGTVTVASLSPSLVVPVDKGGTGVTTLPELATALDLGTAASQDVGTGANNVVQLTPAGALPAVSAVNLTNLPDPLPAVRAVIADAVTNPAFSFVGNKLTR